jgi:hypothetical protein
MVHWRGTFRFFLIHVVWTHTFAIHVRAMMTSSLVLSPSSSLDGTFRLDSRFTGHALSLACPCVFKISIQHLVPTYSYFSLYSA